MKKIFLLIALAISSAAIYAQASVESIIIEKKNRNAVKLYIDQSEDITATALDARLKRSGLNGKRKKGITIYREVILSEISIFIPKASAIFSTFFPISPYPIIPSFFPDSSKLV